MIQFPCFITCNSAIRPYFRSHADTVTIVNTIND
jgi:hypothetical protein